MSPALTVDASTPMSPEAALQLLAQAMEAGHGLVVVAALSLAALTVYLTVSGVRRLVIRMAPASVAEWLGTDRAGVILSVAAGQIYGLTSHTLSGQPVTVGMLLGALSSLLASGGYSWVRKGKGRKRAKAAVKAPPVEQAEP